MELYKTIRDVSSRITTLKKDGQIIGFVPTMGALHEGHISLIRLAREENNVVACSIFVNPIQFNNPEDLKKYPRTLEKDIDMLKQAGCDIVFAPEPDEMYPEPVIHEYDFGMLDKVMEGKFRSGHFNGVAIVVKKLLDIITPDNAYFGEKDFQQLAIIRKLVELESIPVNIIACPTVREPDGLAMSSRNVRLTESQRKTAPVIYRILKELKAKYSEENSEHLIEQAIKHLNQQPEMRVEYLEIVDSGSLQPLEYFNPMIPARACIAVFLGDVRLIDNISLNL
ncbi:MAG: pantoate--beta-alanine ligase [Bacteroidetes bacterium]|nr:pantoate--beta-alanine ligase [Bacteroidota bacterium]